MLPVCWPMAGSGSGCGADVAPRQGCLPHRQGTQPLPVSLVQHLSSEIAAVCMTPAVCVLVLQSMELEALAGDIARLKGALRLEGSSLDEVRPC
jgi:hypothetical protein